mmetsp:Transcript_13948/g.41990  ORF Transcript_13948/g.41990 Transcript_13948/m.41990 type:complete len:218 (-) Transcript_13948:542-1195(-)
MRKGFDCDALASKARTATDHLHRVSAAERMTSQHTCLLLENGVRLIEHHRSGAHHLVGGQVERGGAERHERHGQMRLQVLALGVHAEEVRFAEQRERGGVELEGDHRLVEAADAGERPIQRRHHRKVGRQKAVQARVALQRVTDGGGGTIGVELVHHQSLGAAGHLAECPRKACTALRVVHLRTVRHDAQALAPASRRQLLPGLVAGHLVVLTQVHQ